MREVQVHLREYIDQKTLGATVDVSAITEARDSMDRSIGDYLDLPVFSGEHEHWRTILRAKDALNEAVVRCLTATDHGDFRAAEAMSRNDVSDAAEDLSEAITGDIEFNAAHSRDLALEIKRLRARSSATAFVLAAVCALITAVGAFGLHRAIRSHEDLAERHRLLLAQRASDLDQFAGRVAHDILSPLSAVGFALQLAGRGDEEARAQCIARGTSALGRVTRLVRGLLDFARAGAKSDTSVRTDVRALLLDLAPALESEALAVGAELEIEADVACAVSCNAGVLNSLVANLARNAIKYIGDGDVRRIAIRAHEQRERVRVEVADTGPGLAPDVEDHVFEPYMRGAHVTQAGLGLGLATVKRLAEAHGGRVGVASVTGQGCTFWFELPKAAAEATPAAADTSVRVVASAALQGFVSE
jgi:signal transduction histidine kinase